MKMLMVSSFIATAILFMGCGVGNETSKNDTQPLVQTICFSQYDTGRKIGGKEFYLGQLGDDVKLNGGQCKGATLPEMNKKGWELVQVVSGLENSFSAVFKKVK